jgi:hypothetical protein
MRQSFSSLHLALLRKPGRDAGQRRTGPLSGQQIDLTPQIEFCPDLFCKIRSAATLVQKPKQFGAEAPPALAREAHRAFHVPFLQGQVFAALFFPL